jgi:hypothetical protein
MILSDAVVKVIRDALSDYESATGLECQIRYADRLSAKVEMALESAEAAPVQVNTADPNLHQQIIKMRTNGKSPAVIAKELGISKLNVYDHLKFEREQEAK